MEIKNTLSQLEMWYKEEQKNILEDEYKLQIRKDDFSRVGKSLENLLKPDVTKEENV